VNVWPMNAEIIDLDCHSQLSFCCDGLYETRSLRVRELILAKVCVQIVKSGVAKYWRNVLQTFPAKCHI
jgi:hypothetical protein